MKLKLHYFLLFAVISRTILSSDVQSNGCDVGWYQVGRFCLAFFEDSVRYWQAKQLCDGMEAQLASVWTGEEWNFITARNWKFNSSEDASGTSSSTTTTTTTTTTPTPLASPTTPSPGENTTLYMMQPTAPLPSFGLWTGYRKSYFEMFEAYFWSPPDNSMLAYLQWRSDYDETMINEVDCLSAALDMNAGYIAAFYCSEKMDGYICKKPRYAGYAIGRPADEGTKLMARSNGVAFPSELITTGVFFRVEDISLYASNLTLVGTDSIPGEGSVGVCADHCLSLPLCVYFQTTCTTYKEICDGLQCQMYSYL